MADGSTQMTEELKPCPFCGKDPLLHRLPLMRRCWRVTCKFCDAGPHSSLSEADAITAWNTRLSPSAEKEALIEAAAQMAYRTCAETRHATLGEKVADAIRSTLLSMRNNGNG